MLQVSLLGTTIYEYIVKEDQYKTSKEWFEDVVHVSWKVEGELVRPKGMTRNL
jgi:hypothetical protein